MKVLPMRSRPILAVLAGLCFCAPASGLAGPPSDPTAIVTALVAGVGRMMSDPSLTAGDREREFARILNEDCDLTRVAHYVLGSYFASANDADRQQFDGLFQRWVTRMFAGKIGRFNAASMTVKGVEQGAGSAIVTTEIANGNHPIRIDWRVSGDSTRYRIVDVAMEGISMALVEREEIGDVIRRNGGTVAGLNRALEERLASDGTSTASAAAH